MSDEQPPNDADKAEDLHRRAKVLAASAAAEPEFSRGETIFMVGFFGACLAGIGAIFWASVKEEERQEEEARLRLAERRQNKEAIERWINDEENDRKKVYILRDGRYLSVDRDADQSTHLPTEIQESYRNRDVV